MGDFAEGFVTGFANTLADGINERNKIAQDYFQKQYEIATTVGLENHRKVEQQVGASVQTAKQLQQMGVPKEIIMAVAAQDPMGLGDFYEDISKAQAAGIPIDQNFFNNFVTVSEGFKAPDEDFYTFFKKALSPIQAEVQADPEGFQRDQKGGIFRAMMGADPYGRARKKLDETIVIDGLSASELARYGSGYMPAGSDNAPTVTFDYSAAAKPKTDNGLSVAETTSIQKTLEENAKRIWIDGNTNGNKMSKEEAQALAIEETKKTFSHIPNAVAYLDGLGEESLEEGTGIEETSLPPSMEELGEAGIGAPQEVVPEPTTETTPQPSVTVPPKASEETSEIDNTPINPDVENLNIITIKGNVLTWYANNADGTVSYIDENGEMYDFAPSEVRAFVKQYGTSFDN